MSSRWFARAIMPLLAALPSCDESTKRLDVPTDHEHAGWGATLEAAALPPRDAGLEASLPARPACASDMVLVEGRFCPDAVQICLEHHPEFVENPAKSERCLRYAKPSRCVSKSRQFLRFCIDRYEWPNRVGEKPLVLVQWREAVGLCNSVGKRLCIDKEWLFACEGEEMLPHVYGYNRDDTKCQIDRPYILRNNEHLRRYEQCLAQPDCRKEFDRIDQRQPIGSFPECVSPFGVYDMNGSVNEWVVLPDGRPPHRSGLKGGWWGPVRNRCRPTVRFHREDDWGYEAGFRCCSDAAAVPGMADADSDIVGTALHDSADAAAARRASGEEPGPRSEARPEPARGRQAEAGASTVGPLRREDAAPDAERDLARSSDASQ